ncbi:Hypothetical predicted protein [Cloeon dipterum]|uniref:Uncharacterized protein n=1 Tax=Cloeon dipterum TaxID=197152 RepID=A0A8S1C004_9INSE|nr:Hypothetical predicted protein [Cloeon dipterum]
MTSTEKNIAMENDEKLLALTASRVLNLSRNRSLFELAGEKIVKNINYFIDNESESLRLANYPKMFLRIILKAFLSQSFKSNDDVTMDNFNSKVKIFEFLIINSKPQTIDLEGLLTFCPDNSKLKELTRVVKLIAAHAPDIKSLFICNKIDCCIAVDFGCVVEALCKLKKLELCKTLRNLSHLEIPIAFNYLKENNSDNLTVDFGDIEDLKRCFSALKIFKFDIVMDDEFASEYGEMKLTYLCLNHLPKLEILRFSADNLDIPQVPMNPRLLSKTSNMRHLCVNAGCHLSKEVFCNLTHLKIYWSHYGIPAAYLGFPKIKCIVLDCVPTVCFSENGEQSWYEDSDDSNQDSEEDSDQDSEENYQYIEEDSDQDSEEEDETMQSQSNFLRSSECWNGHYHWKLIGKPACPTYYRRQISLMFFCVE